MLTQITDRPSSHKRILNLLRMNKELSAADLARLSGLQPSTLSAISNDLLKANIIEVSKTGTSTAKGGKRPTLLRLNASVGYVIGMELQAHQIRVVINDFTDKPVYQHEHPLAIQPDPDHWPTHIAETLREVCKLKNISESQLLGLGIAVPGLVDARSGMVYYSSQLGFYETNLLYKLKPMVSCPVHLVNDANAGAMAMSWNECDGINSTNMVYLLYNSESGSFGSGIILNGNLFDGSSGTAGEIISHLTPGFELFAPPAEPSPVTNVTTDWASHRAIPAGNLQQLADLLSTEIVRIIGFINPQTIVLGGDLSDQSQFVNEYIKPRVTKIINQLLRIGFVMPNLCFPPFGRFTVSQGAVAAVYNYILPK